MKDYTILRDPRITDDLQEAIEYYKNKKNDVAHRFLKQVQDTIQHLKIHPLYQVRYKNVRCKPVKGFPYMIHYTVNQSKKIVYIHAVICTYKNPKGNWV